MVTGRPAPPGRPVADIRPVPGRRAGHRPPTDSERPDMTLPYDIPARPGVPWAARAGTTGRIAGSAPFKVR